MPLAKYKAKRDFTKTKEPKGKIRKLEYKKKIFVIHSHFARNHHYDLRLEINRVLKSWAIPKEPPKTKGIKRLAIQVEDHPLAYAEFEGTIPEGNYGAGKVEIWDKGAYELIEKTPNKIIFKLNGKKLKGNYCLIRTNYGGGKKGWLWFKI